MKKLLVLFLLAGGIAFSQPISQYQYVIVPAKFDAQKKPGQFGLNNLTKLFLEKNGYKVFYDTDILPPEVSGESCNKIYANVLSDNSMRTTKLRVQVKDCRNAILFLSDYGTSSEKDNTVAYNQALRTAFRSFDKPEFRYNPSTGNAASKTIEAVAPAKSDEMKNAGADVVFSHERNQPVDDTGILSAQKIVNGYQLVDMTPKVVLRIYKTLDDEIFIAEGEGRNGVVVKRSGKWTFEYYNKDGKFYAEAINIKF
jgi:hypothetical protein